MPELRVPTATYRIQFNRQFGFKDAQGLVPYLHALGITDIYASPLLKAREESTHGYDVTDPTKLNPALGGPQLFAEMVDTLRQHDMGLLMDIVPNHMAASIENRWWLDVLQNGPDSPYASYFDINWQPDTPGMVNKVLIPILGSFYGAAMENQEITLSLNEDGFWITYYENRYPLKPELYSKILLLRAGELATNYAPDHPARRQMTELIDMLENLPPCIDEEFESLFTRIKKKLWQVYTSNQDLKSLIEQNIRILNGQKGDPRSFNRLEELLDEQSYRLAFWRVANQEINYRRFFNITDLVSMRVEDDKIFAATHTYILQLAKERQVTGLRIDHIDGLQNPRAYLEQLQKSLAGKESSGFYIVAEKILSGDEDLPTDWPISGTTGYDFLRTVNELFVNKPGIAVLDNIYARLRGSEPDFAKVEYARKRRVMAELFGGEMRNLTQQFIRLAKQDRHGRDFTMDKLKQALLEVTACFPVYRTYTRDYQVSPRDREYIEQAVAAAIQRHRAITSAANYLRRVLLLDFPGYLPREQRHAWLQFVMRWQQFTGPIMAKGLEDTAMYVYNRLVSLNDVGCEPHSTGITINEFHRKNQARQKLWPHTLNTTSTHDTKRSEDVRVRINLLSEIPAIWADHLDRWRAWNRNLKKEVDDQPVPDGNVELLIYQTLVGAWPLHEDEIPKFKERVKDYIIKASREAKVYTRWARPDTEYEKALVNFVMSILEQNDNNLFLKDLIQFQKIISYYGALSSLAQVLLKISSPGVPDIYQGMELWNFSLVDPDNRRPVDFQDLNEKLIDIKYQEANLQSLVRSLLETCNDGRVKLYLTYKALNFRKTHYQLFASGIYKPVLSADPNFEHVCAFARQYENKWALIAVPRMPARLHLKSHWPEVDATLLNELPKGRLLLPKELWEDKVIVLPEQAPHNWHNVLTGENVTAAKDTKNIALAELFSDFPVALLWGEKIE